MFQKRLRQLGVLALFFADLIFSYWALHSGNQTFLAGGLLIFAAGMVYLLVTM